MPTPEELPITSDSIRHLSNDLAHHYMGKFILIGAYHITLMPNSNVWIQHSSGEGGEFSYDKFETVVAEFYKENF